MYRRGPAEGKGRVLQLSTCVVGPPTYATSEPQRRGQQTLVSAALPAPRGPGPWSRCSSASWVYVGWENVYRLNMARRFRYIGGADGFLLPAGSSFRFPARDDGVEGAAAAAGVLLPRPQRASLAPAPTTAPHAPPRRHAAELDPAPSSVALGSALAGAACVRVALHSQPLVAAPSVSTTCLFLRALGFLAEQGEDLVELRVCVAHLVAELLRAAATRIK